jgi:DNA invertase Pin-like site-specific DNA recombinase
MAEHLARRAVVYVRQSSEHQVQYNTESQRLQYALADRAESLGFETVEVVDADLGQSASLGAAPRQGFDRLLAAVVRCEVGMILSREISRLSRTDTDFCHLIEACQLFGTLLGDAEQVYDPAQPDDQLVLGIKGTLSVVEMRVLNLRLQQGRANKARRGELLRPLPVGYVYDGEGRVQLDPDERIRQAVASVFEVFRRLQSGRQTFLWFHEEDIKLPIYPAAGRRTRERLLWKLPTDSFIRNVLHNPFYAGAWVWGRRPVEIVWQDGRPVRRQGREREPEDCEVFIREHHEGYITWAQYQEHRRILKRNNQVQTGGDGSPVRSGQGLLAGLLRCGVCGRRLYVRYRGKKGTSFRYLCSGSFQAGGKYCLGVPGAPADQCLSTELLRVVSPLGLAASTEALKRRVSEHTERQRARRLELEQLEYEAQRAFEQYDCADPRNRLVAAELERRWNAKLEEVARLRSALDAEAEPELSDDDRTAISWLGEHFEQVWTSPDCPPETKKRIIRTLVDEVIAIPNDDGAKVRLVIHWNGGHHTYVEMPKLPPGKRRATAEADIEIIRKLASRYGDDDIAPVLNRLGRQTATGLPWTTGRVKRARQRAHIAGRKRTVRDPDLLSLAAAKRHCGVSDTTLRRLVDAGLLVNHQVVPYAPWELRRVDLDGEPVRSIIDHLKATGELALDPVCSSQQLDLLK